MDIGIGGYSQIELIGRGGSASVFRAVGADGRVVAIKVLSGVWSADDLRRFSREQEAMYRLESIAGVVPLLGTGVSSQGAPFIVMPYYPGGSLQDRLKNSGSMSEQEALLMISRLGEILTACHSRGIYHRDVKPGNVLIGDDGALWLTDFGITEIDDGRTATTSNLFTANYCPPEAFRLGRNAVDGVAIDGYGLAAMAWALLAGHAPFSGDGVPTDPLAQLVYIDSEPVGSPGAHVSRAVVSVLETAMSKDPTLRYQTIESFIEQLHSPNPTTSSVLPSVVSFNDRSTNAANAQRREYSDKKSKKAILVGSALSISALLVGSAIALWSLSQASQENAGEVDVESLSVSASELTETSVTSGAKEAPEGLSSSSATQSQEASGTSADPSESSTVSDGSTTTMSAMAESSPAASTTELPFEKLDLKVYSAGAGPRDGGNFVRVSYSYRCPSTTYLVTHSFLEARAGQSCVSGSVVEAEVESPIIYTDEQLQQGIPMEVTIETAAGVKETGSIPFFVSG